MHRDTLTRIVRNCRYCTVMLANMMVTWPAASVAIDVPKSEPQILYLFPGLQNIDWIPKVDPMPSQAFDIIQPVLQYPYFSSDSNGKEWGLRSWYARSLQCRGSHHIALRLTTTLPFTHQHVTSRQVCHSDSWSSNEP